MQSASDIEVFELAAKEQRILVSADTDFGTILALRRTKMPSVILFHRSLKRPNDQIRFLLINLANMEQPLNDGSIIILEDTQFVFVPYLSGERKINQTYRNILSLTKHQSINKPFIGHLTIISLT